MELVWLIVAIVFGIMEVITPTLTLIWFSIGALIVMFLSKFIESIVIQFILFSIISTVLLIIGTKKLVNKDKKYRYNTNLQAILEKEGMVTKDILENKIGEVIVDNEIWSAISIDNKNLLKDDIIQVVKIEGVKLVVKKK